ncbi:MAG: hypothetical protein J07HR59_01809, partial [Halorubrum sp. J07HR59]
LLCLEGFSLRYRLHTVSSENPLAGFFIFSRREGHPSFYPRNLKADCMSLVGPLATAVTVLETLGGAASSITHRLL